MCERPGGRVLDIGQGHARIGQCGGNQGCEPFGMGASGNFGNDAAIGAMGIILRGDTLRNDNAPVSHQRGRSFVAGRFYAENKAHPGFP